MPLTTTDPLERAAFELAPWYGMPHGVLVASGQAALELSLELAGVGPGDDVLVPAECCHLVPAAVLRVGAQPVFASCHDRLILAPDGVAAAFTDSTVAAIAVHHLGLPCPIGALREVLPPEVCLVEDAAQAFGVIAGGDPIGAHADYVVASFGVGKPMCLGGGGGVFGRQAHLRDAMVRYGPSARAGSTPPRSYPLHPAAARGVDDAIAAAAQLIAARRATVAALMPRLVAAGFAPWVGRPDDNPSWHRLPVSASRRLQRDAMVIEGAEAVVQGPHDLGVSSLPMFTSSVPSPTVPPSRPLLLRVDDASAVERWLDHIEPGPPAEDVGA